MRDGADPLSLRVMYAIAGAAAWLVFRLFRLRHRVIRDNLARSFPDWPASQLESVKREFVRRQGEVLAELFHTQRLAVEELRSRVRLANPELLANASPGRPVILVGAHHCNSEWTFQRMALEYGERFVALYKPIRNPRVDAWMLRLRTRFGARLIPAKSVLMELARRRDAVAVGLVADQAPTTSPEKHWTAFLNQDTAFYMGPELLARALRSQVLLGRVRRLARGRYELAFEALNAPAERLPAGTITDRYAQALEAWIRDDPAGWWWSHKRWKLKREAG